jgi:carboxypeptidase C (cathepsin A)
MKRLMLAVLMTLAFGSPMAAPQTNDAETGPIASASAQHRVRVGGANIRYRVSWAETVLRDAAGEPQATISATTYERLGVADLARRPVIFAFNGGPGASSSPLHFELLGPRRIDGEGAARVVVDNGDTPLDAADLVLIDPVGTGFSREMRPGGGQAYWSVTGDAAATQELIRTWIASHNRQDSPIFVIGESYGGFRAALVVAGLTDLNLAGVVLVSPALDFTAGGDQSFVFDFPTMAATAYSHGRVPQEGRTVQQVYEEARAFAQTELVAALQSGDLLTTTERDRLAAHMSALIGVPAEFIADANLRVGSQEFLERLLEGRVVGRVDTRVSAPKPDGALVPGRVRQADDPALGLGRSNVIRNPIAGDYFRREVGVQTERDYFGLTLDVNFAFNWNSGEPSLGRNISFYDAGPKLAAFMSARPQSRLLLLSGYYDLATPLLSQTYALAHAGLPRERVATHAFAAGHTPFDDASRDDVAAVIRNFVTAR